MHILPIFVSFWIFKMRHYKFTSLAVANKPDTNRYCKVQKLIVSIYRWKRGGILSSLIYFTLPSFLSQFMLVRPLGVLEIKQQSQGLTIF